MLEEDDDGLSLFDADDQRANGFVKWAIDFSDAPGSSSACAARDTNLDIDVDRVRGRWPMRPPRSSRSASTSTATRSRSSDDYFELNPSAHFRWDVTDRTQLRLQRRPHRSPAELRPAESDAASSTTRRASSAIRRSNRRPRSASTPASTSSSTAGTRSWASTRSIATSATRSSWTASPDEVNAVSRTFVDEDIEATRLGQQPERGQDLGRRVRLEFAARLHRPELPRVRELHLIDIGDPGRQRELPHRPPVLAAAGLHLQRRLRSPDRAWADHLGRELPEARPGRGVDRRQRRDQGSRATSSTKATSRCSSRRRSRNVSSFGSRRRICSTPSKDEIERITSRSSSSRPARR